MAVRITMETGKVHIVQGHAEDLNREWERSESPIMRLVSAYGIPAKAIFLKKAQIESMEADR